MLRSLEHSKKGLRMPIPVMGTNSCDIVANIELEARIKRLRVTTNRLFDEIDQLTKDLK